MYVVLSLDTRRKPFADIMKIAVKYFEYYEKLSQMLERLAEHIEIFDIFAQKSSDEQILHRVSLNMNFISLKRV